MPPDERESIAARPGARSHATRVLTSPLFVIAVAVLLLNDWVLKAAAGNWLTGKLSDVAGLAAFSMFWDAVLPRHRRGLFVVTGLTFAIWKSPLSEVVLQAWNGLAILPVARVVDYSDLLALGVLPLTYRQLSRMDHGYHLRCDTLVRRIGAVATGLLAVIAFTATSVYRPTPLKEEGYSMDGAREEVLAGLDSIRVPTSERRARRDARTADTVVVHVRHPPERWLAITIEVRDLSPGESEIRPIFIGSHIGEAPSPEGRRRAFVAQVVQPLREWLARRAPDER